MRPTERRRPTQVFATCPLRPLGKPNAFTDPVAFEFGERRYDGQEQARDAVAGDVIRTPV